MSLAKITIGGRSWDFDEEELEWLLSHLPPADAFTSQARAAQAEAQAERESDLYMEHGQPGGIA
jgi:hypothetical protein